MDGHLGVWYVVGCCGTRGSGSGSGSSSGSSIGRGDDVKKNP